MSISTSANLQSPRNQHERYLNTENVAEQMAYVAQNDVAEIPRNIPAIIDLKTQPKLKNYCNVLWFHKKERWRCIHDKK